jgi:hypothetical protein
MATVQNPLLCPGTLISFLCLRGMSIATNNRDQKRPRKLDRKASAELIRKNAEDLVMALCGKGFERAYNPDCPPKRRAPNR